MDSERVVNRQAEYDRAATFPDWVARAQRNQDVWRDVYRLARLPADVVKRARAVPGRWRLLALAEDWCGDAFNTVPVIARLADEVPNLELRVLARDDNPALMDAHLTNGSRSIPVVLVLDDEWEERACWGPRPRELQEWVLRSGLALPPADRYPETRRWYARDRGVTTLTELLELLERTAGRSAAA